MSPDVERQVSTLREGGARAAERGQAELDRTGYKYRCTVALMRLMVAVSRLRLVSDRAPESADESLWARVKRGLPKLILVVYIVCNIHVAIFLNYKYEHDFALFQSEQIDRSSRGRNLTLGQMELKQKLSLTIKRAGDKIEMVGGDRNQSAFIYQQICLINIVAGAYFYLFNMLYHRLSAPFHCNPLQDLLDYEHEQAQASNMVRVLVEQMHQSRELFHQCLKHRQQLGRDKVGRLLFANEFPGQFGEKVIGEPKSSANSDSHHDDQSIGARQMLNELQNSGALWPINKSARWIKSRLNWQFYLSYYVFFYCLSFAILSQVAPDFAGTPKVAQASPSSSSKLVHRSVMITIFILAFPGSFYWFNFMLTSFDSICSTKVLSSMLDRCLLVNSRLLDGKQSRAQLDEQGRRLANENLLVAILHYKITIEQFRQNLARYLQVFMGYMLLGTISPTQALLHRPYADPTGENTFISLLCMIYSFPLNISIYPTCSLFSKCQQLFIRMTRLLAHTVEANERLGDAYDEHTISELRKELYQPKEALDRFKSSVFDVSCTYALFCKWNFWLGIILIIGIAGKHSTNSQLLETFVFM